MGFLRKKGPKPAEVTQYTGLQIQSSSPAVPITIAYGINKLAGNLLWYGNFQAHPQYSKNGGKGGGRQTLTGYNYTTAFVFGLCEGPITSVGRVFKDQGSYYPAYLAIAIVPGTSSQGLSQVVSAYNSAQALAYRGVATAESYIYFLGQTATIGNLEFEVYGLKYATAFVNAYDADPAEVIYDFLTSAQYGVGFPAGSIDASTLFGISGGSSYQAYCWAARIAISPVLSNRESANSTLTRWLQLTNSTAVWSEGKLKFIPYAEEPVYGYWVDETPVSFTPNVTPAYHLTDDDFVVDGPEDDPVIVERKDESSIYNVQQIQISDRALFYNSSTVTVWDQNSIEIYGRRDGSTITANEICDKAIAQTVAQLILQRGVYIRNTYSFKLSFEFCLLEPMDIVTLTDSRLGLEQEPVRITAIEESEDGVLTVTAEDFLTGVGTAKDYPVQGNEAVILDRNTVPSAVNPPVIFEPPSTLTDGARQVWLAVSGGLASTRRLEEDGSTGEHAAVATIDYQSASEPATGTLVSFRAYVMSGQRTACRLRINDGVANQSVSFNLATGTSSGATGGITSSSIAAVSGGSWYLVTIECAMAASVDPIVSILLEKPSGTVSYAGTPGEGLFVWNPEFAVSGSSPSILSIPMVPAGATFDADAQDPPLGVEGTADPYWGGCIIHVSTDDVTYGQIGQVDGAARHGTITGESGGVIGVNLVQSGATLDPASPGDAESGVTLSLAGDELFAYSSATLTGPNAYDLSGLARGLYGTASPTHAPGERFARLDDAIFKYTIPPAYVGQTVHLKFQSFNIFGQGLQDLATCVAYTYVPTGAGSGSSILDLLSKGFNVRLPSITTSAIDEPMIAITEIPSDTVRLQGLP